MPLSQTCSGPYLGIQKRCSILALKKETNPTDGIPPSAGHLHAVRPGAAGPRQGTFKAVNGGQAPIDGMTKDEATVPVEDSPDDPTM
jgi:hypothetical protein